MQQFNVFSRLMQEHWVTVTQDQPVLFVTGVDKDALWDMYLNSFPPGTNEVYRKRREFDCSCCRHFIKTFGNAVAIKDNRLVSLWDFDPQDDTYGLMAAAVSAFVKSAPVQDVFVSKVAAIGTKESREQREDNTVHTWNHFGVDLPNKFVTPSAESIGTIVSQYRDARNVFKRSLDELSPESVETVLDFIAEKSIYRGEEWQAALQQFQKLQTDYHCLTDLEKENYAWIKSVTLGGAVSKIRNHSIGTLLQDLTADVELDVALRKYEAIVAPTNYKRPKAVFTAKMVEQAQKKIEEMGLLDSLGRRHAVLADITVNNVLWANRDAQKHMAGVGGVFEALKQEAAVDIKKFDRLPGVSIEKFTETILPTARSLKVLLENRQESNLVSLIAPIVLDSPTLFKWDNNFSWAYNGNIADSMKQRVKAAGGNVEGILRFSLQWNDAGDNNNDFDAHCVEPNKNEIWFHNKGHRHPSTGMLDVDIIQPEGRVAVENITWTSSDRMQEGVYTFFVHNYSHRGGRSGFDAEIEYGGQIYEFAYHKELPQGEKVVVAKVKFSRQVGITFIESLPSTTSAKTVWSLRTNAFHPVSVCLYSPNYWDGLGVGNRHYFFMLAGCRNEGRPNGFYNEFLKEAFMPHRQVFEALGGKMRVSESEDQLSGLGFSSTKRDSLVVEVDGRATKIVF